jgi:hypothetical protein
MAMAKRRLLGGAIVALVLVTATAPRANAAIWARGCASAFADDEQIIFNNQVLLMLAQPTGLGLQAIVLDRDGLEKHPSRSRFKPLDFGLSFEPKLRFRRGETEAPLLLTERNSKRVSHRSGRAGPRDEITTQWRKVYAISGGGEKPRDVVMDCMEYILSTKGGRSE